MWQGLFLPVVNDAAFFGMTVAAFRLTVGGIYLHCVVRTGIASERLMVHACNTPTEVFRNAGFVYTMTTRLHEVVGLVDGYLTLVALYPILECMFSGFSLPLAMASYLPGLATRSSSKSSRSSELVATCVLGSLGKSSGR